LFLTLALFLFEVAGPLLLPCFLEEGEGAFFVFPTPLLCFLVIFVFYSLALGEVLPSAALVESPLGAKVKNKILFLPLRGNCLLFCLEEAIFININKNNHKNEARAKVKSLYLPFGEVAGAKAKNKNATFASKEEAEALQLFFV
jgi:hypothetical protein